MQANTPAPQKVSSIARMSGLIVIVALTAMTIASCASPTTSAQPDSIETSSPSPEVMPESLQRYIDMPSSEFFALPDEERKPLCTWVNRDIADIAVKWQKASGNPLDILPVANEQNTPLEKLQIHAYDIRGAFVSHQNTNEVLDLSTAEKLLSCAFTDMNSPQAQKTLDYLHEAEAVGDRNSPPERLANGGILSMLDVSSFDNPTTVDGITSQRVVTSDGTPTDFVTVQSKDYLGNTEVSYSVSN